MWSVLSQSTVAVVWLCHCLLSPGSQKKLNQEISLTGTDKMVTGALGRNKSLPSSSERNSKCTLSMLFFPWCLLLLHTLRKSKVENIGCKGLWEKPSRPKGFYTGISQAWANPFSEKAMTAEGSQHTFWFIKTGISVYQYKLNSSLQSFLPHFQNTIIHFLEIWVELLKYPLGVFFARISQILIAFKYMEVIFSALAPLYFSLTFTHDTSVL